MPHEASPRQAVIRPADRPGDLGWVVMAHGELYSEQFGFGPGFEALVAKVVGDHAADHDPATERAWIADVDGVRAGCVFLVAGDRPDVAKLRVLLVTPAARGLGLGSRLVEHALAFAREAGYRRVTLWTTDNLTSARRIYEHFGFALTGSAPHRGFGPDLVGQTWDLDLRDSAAA
ncbi:GNAT family N-acetyltransferase [Streptomyces sp. CRN 30]|uniref:GNAT family N-acetyltransferase n=1 Tax=Streptomyces sp. CRN 30 TaxID=3075613 RepID=UPI002A827E8D|nr:GNAT family N-acetyltransferase [Streptomyces sp. CRN 30]